MPTEKRTRQATRPIPEDQRRAFYLCAWDLAWCGHFYTQKPAGADQFLARFGSGSIIARRQGLTILWLTAMAGRFNELARMYVRDVDGYSVSVYRSKGSEDHSVAINPDLIECTTAWHSRVSAIATDKYATGRMKRWCQAMDASPYLLPSINGERMNIDVFNRDVCGPMGELFGCKLSSHCFRDTSCQETMRLTNDVRSVQKIMGHRSVATTEHYLRKQEQQQFFLPLS